jgi:dCMP deaminase
MRKRPNWDEYFLGICDAVSERSHDEETRVGVVITDASNRILATGYNGFPPGCDDKMLPARRPEKYAYMVHAEMNAIASSRQDLRGASLYVSHSPCRECTKAIITAGIRRIVFRNRYENEDFLFIQALFGSCKIDLIQHPQSP